MKKVLFALLAVTVLVASSCSKEAKINRKLDGEWKLTSYNGTALASDESLVYTFSKDKKDNGTGTYVYTEGTATDNGTFTYALIEDKLTTTETFGSATFTNIVTITTFEKKKIEWTEVDGTKVVLEPK